MTTRLPTVALHSTHGTNKERDVSLGSDLKHPARSVSVNQLTQQREKMKKNAFCPVNDVAAEGMNRDFVVCYSK
jgi:hypothetical protein